MIVLARLAALGAPAARHAEVKDHMVVAVGRDDAIFGAARQRRDRGAGQPLREVGGKGSAQIGEKGSDSDQPLPFEKGLEAVDGRFDFWEFGHFACPDTRHFRFSQRSAKGRSTYRSPTSSSCHPSPITTPSLSLIINAR